MKVIDMHCDTISSLLELQEAGRPEGLRSNSRQVDLLRMKDSHYLVQNFALFVVLAGRGDPWERVCGLHRLYQEELEKNKDILAPVLVFGDIEENERAGKLSSLLTVEEGGVCGGKLDRLRQLYQMGVRMLTLTWNFDNEIGAPNRVLELTERMNGALEKWKAAPSGTPQGEKLRLEAQEARDACFHTPNLSGGLTERGREFVAEMENLGMIPDVSHLSDRGFYDVLETATKPFVASHSNARAVCPHVRNMTDDMIRRLARKGGVMGLNFCADFLEEAPLGRKNSVTLEAVVRHARHIVSVGGMEVLGLGSDFDGIEPYEALPGVQGMEALWEAFHRAGFTEGQLDRVFYGNVLRLYRDTL